LSGQANHLIIHRENVSVEIDIASA